MKLRIFAVVATLSLLFGAGIASANGGDGESEGDTRFNFGYDAVAQRFLFNTQATDSSPYDCTLQNGNLTATYGAPEGDIIPVVGLTDDDGTVTFKPTEFALAEGVQEATQNSIGYPGPEDECRISAFAIGDQGHINHGQFMKLFNELIDMRGRGCLNRWLAQSSLGKADQESLVTKIGITFTTALATCDHGNKDKGEDHPGRGHDKRETDQDRPGRGHGNGHQGEADEADQPEGNGHGRPKSPGNSNDAPGRRDK